MELCRVLWLLCKMKFLALGLLLALMSMSTAINTQEELMSELKKVNPTMDLLCVVEHCSEVAGGCLLSAECRTASLCAKKCISDEWDKDNTTEKVHVQNCSNICAFSYRDKTYVDFIQCVAQHECIAFPPIPSHCHAPDHVSPLKQLSTKDLNGSWWVVKGLHPVYDCYPCQHLYFSQINSTAWKYQPKYQVYLANGSLGLIDDAYVLPNTAPGQNISFLYYDLGLPHYETWWLIDEADDQSYLILYYCGHTLQWYYDGALVLSRKMALPDADYSKIAAAYKQGAAVNYDDFCSTKTANCPD